MKKAIARALVAILCLLLATGCAARDGGNTGGQGDEAASLDIHAAAAAILDEVDFQNTLTLAEGNAAANYYALNDAVADFAIYIDGSGASAEEIAVLEAVSKSDVEELRQIVDTRLDNLQFAFENYVPTEMTKINDPVIVTNNRYVVLVVCDDPVQAEDVVAGLFR